MWKPISGYEGLYDISDEGKVRRLKSYWCQSRRRLAGERTGRYVRVRLCNRVGDGQRFLLHRLVYQYFIGPIPDGLTVNHKNGNRKDNRAANLEAATMREQMIHAYATGLQQRAKGSARKNVAKLTEAQVSEIRRRYTFRVVTGKILGAEFGVSAGCISSIIRGDRWSHVA